ncbi:hypothetical protein MSAN_01869700 [Mycena sanguinolenta]|uniref:Transmembrane protein n=1 Tax=Mycena sanguinolenta TaxID=230812 RepID=A0A8H6XRZ4_9AGAR|nr:hypothetical protein MSAN_01869700 [Mycena sanguinolenta]
MSSALFSSFSAFSSSSKASSTVLWVMGSTIQSLFIAFAINTTSTVKTIEATSTIQPVLTPSPCIPVAGSLDRPYMAVATYIGVIIIFVAWILSAKTSHGAASPCAPPPNPDPPAPDPGSADTSPQSRDSAPPPQSDVAAAGAPPPPPPGNDTTCGNERHRKRSFLFRFFAFILGIFLWILRSFKWVFVKTVWRPVAIMLSAFFYYVIIPIILKEIGTASRVTPVLASATGPYIFEILKLTIDSSATLRWLTLWGLAQFLCWIIHAVFRVVSFICGTVFWAVGFTWWTFSTICLRSIQSVLAVPTVLRRIRRYLHRLWSRCRSSFAGDIWLMVGCVLFVLVYMTLELLVRARRLAPFILELILHCHELVLLVGSLARKAPPVIHLLRESEPWQTAVFWWEWIIAPSLMLMAPEDVILVVSIALLSMLIRWIFSSKRSDRAARRKLEKRIKLLETRP